MTFILPTFTLPTFTPTLVVSALTMAILAGGATALSAWAVIPMLKSAGLRQRDMHKPDCPLIPEMGGLALLAGAGASILLIMRAAPLELPAILCAVIITGAVGLLDDVIGMRQVVKAAVPVLAAIPLSTLLHDRSILVPFIGQVGTSWLFPLIVGSVVTVAPNVINMVGGFNGTELGIGLVVAASLAVVAYLTGEMLALTLLSVAVGSAFALLCFNWCPAKVFLGDVGAFTLGGLIAAAVVVGDLEVAGAILLLPLVIDTALKLPHRLPKTFARLGGDGKLYCPQSTPVGLAQLVLKLSGGLTEGGLALRMMAVEGVFGAVAIAVYVFGATV